LNRPGPGPATAGGIPCDNLEHTQVHYHAALQIMYHGISTNLPDNTGINFTDSTQSSVSCYYWLHVHASQKNIIHIESPANQTFTLGQFFQVWDAWSRAKGTGTQRLDSTHVSQFTLAPTDKMVVYIDKGDGKGAQVYTGDPKTIVLTSHEVITIEIAPPDVTPPPAFTFPSGLYRGRAPPPGLAQPGSARAPRARSPRAARGPRAGGETGPGRLRCGNAR